MFCPITQTGKTEAALRGPLPKADWNKVCPCRFPGTTFMAMMLFLDWRTVSKGMGLSRSPVVSCLFQSYKIPRT